MIPFLILVLLGIHASLYGITDDEAYYWVLSRTPLLGYAYHPPAVAWIIGVFEWMFAPIRAFVPPTLIVRLPAILVSTLLVWTASRWFTLAGVQPFQNRRATLTFIAFPGLLGVSWMMVPDVPLLLGWILVFVGTWRVCFAPERWTQYALLILGAAFAMVSKLAGVFILMSAVLCIFSWSFSRRKKFALASLVIGAGIGFFPFLLFNLQHSWGPVMYQLSERHASGGVSFMRLARFWFIILAVAGPVLVAWLFILPVRSFMKDASSVYVRVTRFIFFWVMPPALVFCVQPLFSEFKPHWALMAWMPLALWLGYNVGQGRDERAGKIHRVYGTVVLVFVFLACHVPIAGVLMENVARLRGKTFEPRFDVTSDAYGWDTWAHGIGSRRALWSDAVEVVGARYQTASQASFALANAGIPWTVARIPRTEKEGPEWPAIQAISEPTAAWPELHRPILFVLDHRYTERPQFSNADCQVIGRESITRGWIGREIPAKWIETYYCEPR